MDGIGASAAGHSESRPAGVPNQAMFFGQLPSWERQLTRMLPLDLLLPPAIAARSPSFDQAIVNLYRPGEGICSHVDLARFQDGIVSVSIGGPVVMHFRRCARSSADGGNGGAAGYGCGSGSSAGRSAGIELGNSGTTAGSACGVDVGACSSGLRSTLPLGQAEGAQLGQGSPESGPTGCHQARRVNEEERRGVKRPLEAAERQTRDSPATVFALPTAVMQCNQSKPPSARTTAALSPVHASVLDRGVGVPLCDEAGPVGEPAGAEAGGGGVLPGCAWLNAAEAGAHAAAGSGAAAAEGVPSDGAQLDGGVWWCGPGHLCVLLQGGDLLGMAGEARYAWEHGIPAVAEEPVGCGWCAQQSLAAAATAGAGWQGGPGPVHGAEQDDHGGRAVAGLGAARGCGGRRSVRGVRLSVTLRRLCPDIILTEM